RPRSEHLESVADDTVARMAALRVIASVHRVHCDHPIMAFWIAVLGDKRAEDGFPWQKFGAAGGKMALGTDARTARQLTSHNLFNALTTRSALDPGPHTYHPERIVTPAQALEGLTFGPAVAGGFGDGVGELAPGGPANLVVLDVDPFADHSDRLLNARVLTTIVDGAAVWSDPDSPQQR